ncbi:hypothetical protein BGX27_000366 [Mortierella sp. AM989]|nr:hypothetical protein BGX27_000366 [Mortierella sp. AM989]
MKSHSAKDITAAFKDYYRQCYPEAEIQLQSSVVLSKIMFGQKWTERLFRHIILNYIPLRLMHKQAQSYYSFRPQVNWLPLVEQRGTGEVVPQDGRNEAALKLASKI